MTKIICFKPGLFGVVAQMARASALQAEGRGFESLLLHNLVSLWVVNRILTNFSTHNNSDYVC